MWLEWDEDDYNSPNFDWSSPYKIWDRYYEDQEQPTETQMRIFKFSAFNDILTGSVEDNVINGGPGADTIDGGAGNDVLDGGDGDDKITGNTGIDTVSYASAIAGVIVNLGTTKAQNTSGAGTDTIATVENVEGSAFNDTLVGSTANNLLNGGAGDDLVEGKGGDDTLDGGAGNDRLTGDSGADTASYASASASVTVNLALSAAQNTIGAGIDTLSTIEHLVGSRFGDTLTGSSGANTITGGAGNDVINGAGGTDIIRVAGLRSTYTLQTVNGQVQLVDNDAVADGDDGTDTLIGIETVQFKDQSMGIVSPIILDLDGDGIETMSASAGHAQFDMDGDGRRDDTSWIGGDDGFLFLDRDGDGTVSSIAELSFISDVPGAGSDLEGLRAFDSNHDGVLSADDERFLDFKVWRDSNGNGHAADKEIVSLAEIGLASIELNGVDQTGIVETDGVAILSLGLWTRNDGSSMIFADAAMTYAPTMRPRVEQVYDFDPMPLDVAAQAAALGHRLNDHVWLV